MYYNQTKYVYHALLIDSYYSERLCEDKDTFDLSYRSYSHKPPLTVSLISLIRQTRLLKKVKRLVNNYHVSVDEKLFD